MLFFLDILKEIPNHKEAVSLLTNISADWEKIGLALNVSRNDLKSLRRENIDQTIKLSEVIAKWMETKSSSPVSWETLISAIKGPIVKNKQKAKEIRDYLYSQH